MSDELVLISSEKKERADATRNRQLLLDTAVRMFREAGVENITMSAIAEAAQVGKGTLYRHFTDKSDLIMALLHNDMTVFQQEVFAYLSQPVTPCDKIRWFLAHTARYVMEHIGLLRVSFDMNPEFSLRHPAHLWWRQTIRGLLAQIANCEDVDYTADVLYLMLDVQTIRFQVQTQNYTLERVVSGLHFALDKLTA